VHEESICVVGKVSLESEKQRLVDSAVVQSEKTAIARGDSLALIRPMNPRLKWVRRSMAEIETAREAFEAQARQASMFDKKLDLLEPCPFIFKLSYEDDDGPHEKTCADWETSAAFFNLSKKLEEKKVLEHLSSTYCKKYVENGLVLALGNMAKRPQTWQLLGIFPSRPSNQMSLDL